MEEEGATATGVVGDTRRDIVFAWHGEATLALGASALMSQAVHTCHFDDSVRSVMTTMTNSRVRHRRG
jgi:hypothetical protein